MGIPYFRGFESRLKMFSFPEIIECLTSKYPNRYVVDFLLSTPFLWAGLPPDVWVNLLPTNIDPLSVKRAIDHISAFADVEFLNRYVGVDALRYLLDSKSTSHEQKRILIAYFRKFPDSLARCDLDLEELDGDYFVDSNEIRLLAETLCRSFGFEKFNIDGTRIDSYLKDFEAAL